MNSTRRSVLRNLTPIIALVLMVLIAIAYKTSDNLIGFLRSTEPEYWSHAKSEVSKHPFYQAMLAYKIPPIPIDQLDMFAAGIRSGDISHLEQSHPETIPMLDEFKRDPTRKLLMTDLEFNQIFLAYADPKYPVFITSDSILNAYHVAFVHSLEFMDRFDATMLPSQLELIQRSISRLSFTKNNATTESARKTCRIVIGVAQVLMSPSAIQSIDPAIHSIIRKQVRLAERASSRESVDWIGNPEIFIDYTTFKPTATYADDEMLARYYRTVRWLQSVPLLYDKDDQLFAAMILAKACDTQWFARSQRTYQIFGGPSQIDLQTVAKLADDLALSTESIPVLRERIIQYCKEQKIEDSLDITDLRRNKSGTIRLIAATRPVENHLFDVYLRDPKITLGEYSAGVTICAALGSSFAKDMLPKETASNLEALAGDDKVWPVIRSLHDQHLRCLRLLCDSPPDGAPPFMSDELWKRKTCQAVAASWAQDRNAGLLHNQRDFTYLNGSQPKIWGTVEPDPDFFRAVSELARKTDEIMTFPASDRELAIILLESTIDSLIRKNPGISESHMILKHQTKEEYMLLCRLGKNLDQLNTAHNLGIAELGLINLIKMHHLLKTASSSDSSTSKCATKIVDSFQRVAWSEFAKICDRLAVLAEMELKGIEFTQEDSKEIRFYGDRLAGFYGYLNHAAIRPRDDASRVATVFSDTQGNHLAVGVGRPRALYVLFPYQGQEILCRGAVMPYYEFVSSTVLNDAEWRSLAASPRAPQLPNWIRPLVAPKKQQ
ncbi:DUF3160 domain-containing protein [bacterium]|nr:DUF3160 domain-containing protein [bacterium]